RGSIITPLKDRIASQILTHYPTDVGAAQTITSAEAWTERDDEVEVEIPNFIEQLVESIAFHGRKSEFVDQTSGVSARLSIAARELLHSQVERRHFTADAGPVARLIDVGQLVPALTGKMELVYEGEQEGTVEVARRLMTAATQEVFDAHFPDVLNEGREGSEESDRYKPILDWFASGEKLELSDTLSDEEYLERLDAIPGLGAVVDECFAQEKPLHRGAAMELVLDGLHSHSLLAKEDVDRGCAYTDMLGIMMRGLQ
ncbi:MAG: magnesium chelatase, partial [Planctomycetota bacterium]